jgi:S1-C subfamily serine protease
VRASLDMQSAVEVVSVVEGSPAELAGVRPEDLIVEVDGTPTASVDELQRLMVEELIGRPVRAKVVREGRVVELRLVPAEMG